MRRIGNNGYEVAALRDEVEKIKKRHNKRDIILFLGAATIFIATVVLGIIHLSKKRLAEEEQDWENEFEEEFFDDDSVNETVK